MFSMLSRIKFSKKMLIGLKEAKQKHDFRKMCSLVLNFWPPLYSVFSTFFPPITPLLYPVR